MGADDPQRDVDAVVDSFEGDSDREGLVPGEGLEADVLFAVFVRNLNCDKRDGVGMRRRRLRRGNLRGEQLRR